LIAAAFPRIDLDDVTVCPSSAKQAPVTRADVAPADDSYPHLPVILRFVTSELGFGMGEDIRLREAPAAFSKVRNATPKMNDNDVLQLTPELVDGDPGLEKNRLKRLVRKDSFRVHGNGTMTSRCA
jgi:hypothetical protein